MKKALKLWTMATLMAAASVAQAADVSIPRDGYSLQAEESGTGSTIVVFESGFGQGASAWKPVTAALGPQYKAIAYARAGLGKSGTDGVAKRIDAHLRDLEAVIDTLAPGQNVILVGHSYGGLLATEFARRHPQRLRGLVLVDPATMTQRQAYKKADAAHVLADDDALLGMLPPSMAADYRELIAQLDAADASATPAMPDVPVVLLTATQVAADPFVFEETAEGKVIWKAQHSLLFAAFNRGNHRYVDTGHSIAQEQPTAVVDAIDEVTGMWGGPAH